LTIGIQELTSKFELCNIELLRQSLFPPSRLETLRVFVDRKNYRLQDIQLRKNNVRFDVRI